MVVAVDVLVEAIEHAVQRQRLVVAVQRVQRQALDRHLRRDPQRAERHARRAQRLWVGRLGHVDDVARRGHQAHADDPRGEVAEAPAGPVRRRRQRAGERLRVDVTLVLQRQPVARVLQPEVVQRDARLHGHQAGLGVGVDHALHPGGVDQQPVGARDVGERVPAARGANGQATGCGLRDDLGQLVLAGRSRDLRRRAVLIARPVLPGLGHRLPLAGAIVGNGSRIASARLVWSVALCGARPRARARPRRRASRRPGAWARRPRRRRRAR